MVILREEGESKGQEQGEVLRSKSTVAVDQRAVERCTGREREQGWVEGKMLEDEGQKRSECAVNCVKGDMKWRKGEMCGDPRVESRAQREEHCLGRRG